MKTYTRAQSYLWVFDRSLICLLLGYIFDTWQLWGELDEITIFYEDLNTKTTKKVNLLERSPHSCHDNVDEILLSGASAMRSSGQTDGHRKTYDIESRFKILKEQYVRAIRVEDGRPSRPTSWH